MSEKKIKQRWVELPFLYKIQLISFFIAGLCGAISYPLTTKVIYSSVEVDILAERLVLSSVIGLVLSWLWLTIQERMFKYFIWFTLIEFALYTGVIAYAIIFQNYDNYLIWSTIIAATIGHVVAGGGQKLHQKITDNEQYRTDYSFFIEIISSIGILIGSGIAVIGGFGIAIAFILMWVSLICFQMTDIYVYQKVKKYEQNIN